VGSHQAASISTRKLLHTQMHSHATVSHRQQPV